MSLILCGVRCLKGTRSIVLLRSMVHSHTMFYMAGAHETLVLVKSICKTNPQGHRARAGGVLNSLSRHQRSFKNIYRRVSGAAK